VRVHFITNIFAPDELAGASLNTDLALFLHERGHDVRVTTTFSYYPAWKVRPEDSGVAFRDEIFRGIPLRRVWMYVPGRPTGKTRLLSDLSFLWSLLWWGRHRGWRPDVVLTTLPMLSMCLAQRFQYFGGGVPKLIIVQDFVVAAALELGILKLPGLGGLLEEIERFALGSAKTIVTISPEMLEKLRAKFGDSDRRLQMIPNWIHGSLQAEVDRQAATPQRRKERLLFYGGNLGVKQGLPDFLNDFQATQSDWCLDIHGGGAEAERLRSVVRTKSRVTIGGTLEEAAYITALRETSACLITQRPGVGANFLPSKLLPALATGTPVLAICDPASPLGREVHAGGFGTVVAPGDSDALAGVLHAWGKSPELLAGMSSKARARAVSYSRERILPLYEQELTRLLEEKA
jgi:colanic acid biosynthesis glycosyl transferase WcaI